MTMRRTSSDPRLATARYLLDGGTAPIDAGADGERADDPGRPSADQRAQAVEVAIQQAIRRGDFDGLPGAGKPLADIGGVRDPDWWIRRKIEREGLTGLGPPALTLRTENATLTARLDALGTEDAVRAVLEDFNARVREARRQLLGGPPVVTRPRDVEAEVTGWRARRDARRQELQQERKREAAALAARTWRERWRARRQRGSG